MNKVYLKSKLDHKEYCKSTGNFSRHLKKYGLTYREYYEQYITKKKEYCGCGKVKTFYQRNDTYAKSCGNPKCVGRLTSTTKQNWTNQRKQEFIDKKAKTLAEKPQSYWDAKSEKAKITYKLNHGVEWGTSEEQKEKSKQTKFEKHGNAYYNNSEQSARKNRSKTTEEQNIINDKRRQTCLKKYGVENVWMLPGNYRKVNRGNSSIKEYILPSGKLIGIRGYEPSALNDLFESGYTENELEIHNDNDAYDIKIFEYKDTDNHLRKYYPDIFIPAENKIIEVKSEWWWNGYGREKYKNRLINNLRKKDAVINEGYNYEVWLFTDKDNYKILTWEN